jgi:hypothetical protein
LLFRASPIASLVRAIPSTYVDDMLAAPALAAVRATSTASMAHVRRAVRPMLSRPDHMSARHRSATGARWIAARWPATRLVVLHVGTEERIPAQVDADLQGLDGITAS